MGNPTYSIEVDLDGDTLYEPGDDVLPAGRVDAPPRFGRGNDGARIISPPEAGTGEAVLDNRDASLGPSSGLVKGRAIRLRETGGYDGVPRRMWAGITDEPRLNRTRLDSTVALTAFGNLARIVGKSVATRLYENVRTDEAFAALCDAAGFPKNVAEYVLQDVAVPPSLYWILDDAAASATVGDSSASGADGTVGADVSLGNADGLDDEGRTNARSQNTADSIISLAGGSGALPLGASARTYLLRVRFGFTGGPANTAVFGHGVHSANEAFNVQRTGAFGDDALYVWAFSNDVVLALPAGANMSDGEDHTLVITVQADGVTARAFWDGQPGAPSAFGVPINTGDDTLRLGQTTGAGAFAFFDRWAHFAIWDNYAMTPAEVAAIHSRILQARRRFDEGKTILRRWWLGDKDGPAEAFRAALVLKYTEGPGSNIYEDGGGALVFKNRHSLVVEDRSKTSQVTFSDEAQPSPSDISYTDGRADAINYAEIPTVTREAQGVATVWTFGEPITLSANQEIVLLASTDNGDPVKDAVTPSEGGGDFTVTAGSVSTVALDRVSGGLIPIRITAGAAGASISAGLRLRADRLAVSSTVTARSQMVDVDALDEVKPWDKPVWPDIEFDVAQGMADIIPGWYGEGSPSTYIEVRGDNEDKLDAQFGLEIQDRVTVEDGELDLDLDAYVFNIEHSLDAGDALLVTRYYLGRALGNVYGVWDEGLWDVSLWGW